MSKSDFFERKKKIKDILKSKDSRVRFLGIGGVGMYSLARITHNMGFSVSGRDRSRGELFCDLERRGLFVKTDAETITFTPSDILVYSHAVPTSDKEIVLAKEKGTLAVSRAEYLGALMDDYRTKIGVSGSHGKSTTVAMLAEVFCAKGESPTVISGARLPRTGSPLLEGNNDYLIYEACEYKDSFLSFSPSLSLFLNLELDHTDYFRDIEDIKKSFLEAINLAQCAVINNDDDNLFLLGKVARSKIITYAVERDADYTAINIQENRGFYSFDACFKGEILGRISLSVPGKFNVSNALGAVALAHTAGACMPFIISALSSFSGIERRIEKIGTLGKVAVYYDYAHHPTEIRATIEALRLMNEGKIAVIFRPHTYSRTEAFFDGFKSSLSLADRVYLCEIDAVREKYNPSVSSYELARSIGARAVVLSENLENMDLSDIALLVVMGAGDTSLVLQKIKSMLSD